MVSNVSQPPLKRILLLGAGFSKPAGIPTINQMTDDFLKNPQKALKDNEKNKLTELLLPIIALKVIHLENVTKMLFGRSDLEYMLTLLRELEDEQDLNHFESRYPDLKKLFHTETDSFSEKKTLVGAYRKLLQSYVRNACENISSIEYLYPLTGLIETEPLSIFTLNYDGIIENFCEQEHIKYQDGFNPQWNHDIFDKETAKINLYKLHGSLYWVRTKNGNVIKVPVQGLDLFSMKYIDGSPISEMMLYPELQKDKEFEVYTWLHRRFKDELNKTDLCIIIGYIFRDREVKTSILESLHSNPNLWLIIVNPNASIIKHDLVSDNENLSPRIIQMDVGVESALTERKLSSLLQTLHFARRNEENTEVMQKTSEVRLDYMWVSSIDNYLRINHHDKVKSIMEQLVRIPFSRAGNMFPNVVEGVVNYQSLVYALEYFEKKDHVRCSLWKKIFFDVMTAYEYIWFITSIEEIRATNPIQKSELPSFCQSDSGSKPDHEMSELLKKLKTLQPIPQIKESYDKLIETLEFLLTKGNHSNVNRKPAETIEGYRTHNLGLRKWATEIIDSLN
jgi:hypothetical protein